jgi:hypothetical protein
MRSMLGGRGRTAARQLDKVELLALFWSRDVRGDEGVHERLKVGAPPLCQCVADGCEALVQAGLEAFDLVVFCAEVVAGAG